MKYNTALATGIVTGVTRCTIECIQPVGTPSAVGADTEMFGGIGWEIVSDATGAGSIDLQLRGTDGVYRTLGTSVTVLPSMAAVFPFPITSFTANYHNVGSIMPFYFLGARFLV